MEWIEVDGVKRQSREAFFACLGQYISQTSLKEITVTGSNSAIHVLWKRERGRNTEGSYMSHLVQDLCAPTNNAPQRK